jgi:hypothetical protein
MKVFPNPGRHYVLRLWAKAEDLSPARMAICLYDGDRQVDWYPIDVGPAWKKAEYPILTGDMKDARVYLGSWDAKRGKFWVSGLEVLAPGLVNVLRRPGAPLTVRKEAGGEACGEGRDFAPVSDPALKINQGYHTPPAIRALPGGNLRDGDRLLVSYYVHPVMRKGQTVTCMSEPQTYELWQKAVAKTWETVQPHYWYLDMDEVRCGGTCQACRDRKNVDGTSMTSAQILGDCVTRQFGMIRAVCPDATVAMWSDMLDPNHNGKDEYHFVPGGYAGAWKYIPRDLVMCPWYLHCGKESLAFFEGLGMRTIAGAYYDASSLDDSKKWLDLVRSLPHGSGMAYITWENKYSLMAAFGDMISSPAGAIPAAGSTRTPPPSVAGHLPADRQAGDGAGLVGVPPLGGAAPAADLLAVASPAADDPSWTPLFNGQSLDGWTVAKGSWQVADGCVVGSAADSAAGARIDSKNAFGDCEIVCRLCADNCKYARIQLRDWGFKVVWPSGQEGVWRTFRLVSRGAVVQASLDGTALKPEGVGKESAAGAIRVFIGTPYGMKIKDARVRVF